MQFAAESSSLEMLWSTGLRKLLDYIAFHTGKQSIGLQNMKELMQVCMVDGDTRPSPQKRRLLWNEPSDCTNSGPSAHSQPATQSLIGGGVEWMPMSSDMQS
eukprot:g34891.t1